VNAKRGTTAEGAESAERKAVEGDGQIVDDGVKNGPPQSAGIVRGSAESTPSKGSDLTASTTEMADLP
jgi:hypothetical protein